MCGIIGIYLHKEQKNIHEVIESYNMLTNRGPDSGIFINGNERIIGFRRLAIMDKSEKAEQPFDVNGDKLLCNGEIFNHKELIEKYDLKCQSKSDCECIIHLYHKIGFEKMIKELNGDFAIILFTNDKVYFGRDRIGVRPLFYGFTNEGNFAIASYARALTKYCVNISPVFPGWGEYDCKKKIISLFYYDSHPKKELLANAEEKIKNTLIDSVKDRLMSERPIGCLLSGGLDSSLIASILCKLIGNQNVRTYSIGIEGSEDLKNAKIVAEYLGTKHSEILFTVEEGISVIPHVIEDLESYDITTIRASVPMWLLAKYISKNTDDIVLFSGEGADELFCGYLYFHYAPSLKELGDESTRLIKELHMYDVLRADRCISSHGLELRVPFLDKRLVEISQTIDSEQISPRKGMEKHLLRTAFKEDFLPESILWRRKDGMSDGVSGNDGKKWYQQIQEYVELEIGDDEFESHSTLFPSKEAYYYKKVFDKIFPTYKPVFDYWLPRWVECNGDPSGRNLKVFNEKSKAITTTDTDTMSMKQKGQLKGYLNDHNSYIFEPSSTLKQPEDKRWIVEKCLDFIQNISFLSMKLKNP
jgi:asparagine synthase (glutamine-hydrolysing)